MDEVSGASGTSGVSRMSALTEESEVEELDEVFELSDPSVPVSEEDSTISSVRGPRIAVSGLVSLPSMTFPVSVVTVLGSSYRLLGP